MAAMSIHLDEASAELQPGGSRGIGNLRGFIGDADLYVQLSRS